MVLAEPLDGTAPEVYLDCQFLELRVLLFFTCLMKSEWSFLNLESAHAN